VQVNAVLIDELAVDESTSMPMARPVLYSFGEPRLVSARRVQSETLVGPVGLLDDGSPPTVQPYDERPLAWDGRRTDAFSYIEPWTVPAWTLYVLLPPASFTASSRSIRDLSGSALDALTVASSEDRLFYFCLFGHAADRHGFQVEARLERDPDAVQRELAAVETVKGRRKWETLSRSIVGPLQASRAIASAAAAIRTLFGV
jgi:hypothetical protein